MAPKEDKEQNTHDQDIVVDALFWSRLLSRMQQIHVVDRGSPQPDDELKMEQIAAAVPQFPAWGPDGIPPNGYPAHDPRWAKLRYWLHRTLDERQDLNLNIPQKLRIWDLLQNKYNF